MVGYNYVHRLTGVFVFE